MAKANEPVVNAAVDPMEYVPYYMRREFGSKDKGRYVSVNKLRIFVPYGEEVMIPRCAVEVLERSLKQDEATMEKMLALGDTASKI